MKVADAGDRGRFSWRVARRHDVVVLRDFELGDQPEVRRLILSGMRERWRERYDDAANPDVDDMSSYLANGGEVVVWEEHGAVVATGTLALEPDGGGRIAGCPSIAHTGAAGWDGGSSTSWSNGPSGGALRRFG